MKISIITVSLNAGKTIKRTFESVINQSFSNIEYIIIDGGSTDGTLKVVEDYADYISYFVSEKDKGVFDAMNKGIRISTGDLVGIINADDWLEPNACEIAAKEYSDNAEDLVICGKMNVWENERLIKTLSPSTEGLRSGMTILHPASFVTRELYEEYGLYNTDYYIASDYDLYLKMYLGGVRFRCINEIFANFALGGISTQNKVLGKKEENIISLKYGSR